MTGIKIMRRVTISLLITTFLILASCSDDNEQPETPTEVMTGEIIEPELVLIPGGTFLMGKEGDGDNSPIHEVSIDSLYLDKYEITNAQYKRFCDETEHRLPEFWGVDKYRCGPEFPNHPVIGVSMGDARDYAEWRGMRLPTEAEWEFAARGGLEGMAFAFGDELDTTKANYWNWDAGGSDGTKPVGSFEPNGYGINDMTGNVCEWTTDYYAGDYYANSPIDNPQGPERGRFKIIRGGGWHSGPSCVRVDFRNAIPGGWLDINVGFRCVKDLHADATSVDEE